ncbi:MAG: Xaa-Pro dipeptidyl-peptidase [Lactovum sp.]
MAKFNHFSIIEKTYEEKLKDFKELNLDFSSFNEKEILKEFFSVPMADYSSLQATRELSLENFLADQNMEVTWDIFWTLALQVQGFILHFDFETENAQDFARSLQLPLISQKEMSTQNLTSALYLLLLSRRKNGMTLVEQWVSEGLIPADNQFHFFNDKALSTFNQADFIREIVWVETEVDTQDQGKYDLVKLEIHRPLFDGKVPAIMTASPYHLGMNEVANDKKLHKMEGELKEKKATKISVHDSHFKVANYKKNTQDKKGQAEKSFTHSWTYSLNDYFLSRGFASLYIAGVGTRDSDGFQSSGDYQQIYSMKAAIDWLNGRARAFSSRQKDCEVKADWASGKVATTGQSYLGTMSYGLATTAVEGLEVILAQAGISSWYHYYREGGLVRSPGGYPGEDLDVLAELTYSRNMSANDFLKSNALYQTQLEAMSQALDRDSGDYNQFWEDRNYLKNIDKVKADILILHGLQDFNVTCDHAYHYWHALDPKIKKHFFLHRGSHLPIHNWQSIDFTEIINHYFTAKLLARPLKLNLPAGILQNNHQEQSWKKMDTWGGEKKKELSLGNHFVQFENAYPHDKFLSYSQSFESFKKELFKGQAQAITIDLTIEKDFEINGISELEIKLRINDTKGLLSCQLLDFGQKKRLADRPSIIDSLSLDRGRLFKQENLLELPFKESPYQLISKAFINLQNREGLMENLAINAKEWMTVKIPLQPTIYQLEKGDQLRLLIYSTDFEHTIRDNRQVTYEIDLSKSKLILPHI